MFKDGTWAQLSPSAKAVLAALCSFTDDLGTAYPSTKKLADICGISKRSAQMAVAELRQRGLIIAIGTNRAWRTVVHRVIGLEPLSNGTDADRTSNLDTLGA